MTVGDSHRPALMLVLGTYLRTAPCAYTVPFKFGVDFNLILLTILFGKETVWKNTLERKQRRRGLSKYERSETVLDW